MATISRHGGPVPRSGVPMQEAPMQDTKAPSQAGTSTPPTDVPHRSKRRFGAVTFGLVAMPGLGWVGGLNAHRLIDVDQVSVWLQQSGSTLASGLESVRKEAVSRINALTSQTVSAARASQDPA